MKTIKKLSVFLSLVLETFVLNYAAAQNFEISPHSLLWTHDDISTQSIYIFNRDSLTVSLNSSGLSHFTVTPQQGLWRVDLKPSLPNSNSTAIIENLYINIDNNGTPITETIPLTHQGYTNYLSLSGQALSWAYNETTAKTISLNSNESWSALLIGNGFWVNPLSGASGQSTIYIAPSGINNGTGVVAATLRVHCGQRTYDIMLSQTPNFAISGLSQGTNYIQTTTYTGAGGSSSFRDVSYFDGLGYPMQTLQIAASPSGKTIAVNTIYDIMHRPDSVSLLQYVRNDGNATQQTATESLSAQSAYYYGLSGDTRPFAQKCYEQSPFGRLLSIQREGDEWNANGGHQTTLTYGFNTATDSVMRFVWTPGPAGAPATVGCPGNWPAGTLSKVRTTDENGDLSESFTDASGRTVCTRRWSGSAATGILSETFFAYDFCDSLVLVIQPEGAAALKALPAAGRIITLDDNSANTNNGIYREFCFGYIYDGWGNLLSVHVPGGGTAEYVYDARDRLVLETNDLMAETDVLDTARLYPRYIHTIYDSFDHVAAKQVVRTSATLSSLRDSCSSYANVPATITATFTHVCPLYSAEYFPFGALSMVDEGFVPETGVVTAGDLESTNIMGMLKNETFHPAANADGTTPTGGISRTKRYYYDYRGRTIQVKVTDSDGWSARYSTKYNFVGNVLKEKETHTDPNDNAHSLLTEYTYDNRGRRLQSWRYLDDDPQTIVFYSYDELGRPSGKTFGDGPGEVGTESISYDIHGWPLLMETKKDWGMTTMFSETLRYASPVKPGTNPRYDGNISEIAFSAPDSSGTPVTDTYGYIYDGMARLTDATHYAGTAITSDNLKTERGITYDRNGNITGLNRVKDAAWNSEILAFTHTGNRITQWADVSGIESGSYTYDAMGNRLTDSNKSLQFSYNLANLPCRVEGLAGGANAGLTLSYSYLADGTKTSAVANGGGNVDGLRYRGSLVYEVTGSGERLCSIAWDEGRISLDYSQNPANPAVRDEWHVRDHLGSTRAVVNLTDYGTVLEQNEYLPFGTRLNSTQSLATNRYRFGGKEEQRFGTGASSLDLHLSDFGARYYDPFTARWTTLDPLAWKYYSLSPYNYCAGNPANLVDTEGKKIVISGNATYRSKVYAAINHMNAHGVGGVIDRLGSSKETYTIMPGNTNSYSSKNRTISWNPDYMKLDESGKVMHSPTVSLAHELGHAEHYDSDGEKYKSDSNTDDMQFVTVEEKNVIEGIEQDTARALGEISTDEVTRTSHGGQFGPKVATLSPKSQSDKAFMYNHPLIKIPETAFTLSTLMY